MKIIGHRGWRGNYPENTIIGIKKAIELGVNGIEIDLVVNAEMQLVLSHEPWMHPDICEPGGQEFNLFQMDQNEIMRYDCGLKKNRLEHQLKIKSTKPLFEEVRRSLNWNGVELLLEIKSHPKGDGLFHPHPTKYAEIVAQELESFTEPSSIFIMSFDLRILSEIQKLNPKLKVVLVTEKETLLPDLKLDAIAPNHQIINERNINEWKDKGLQIFCWTVNELKDIRKCSNLNVDAIISDYPNRLFG
ncbi:MAG: glycerophosphoryl diester phosphodiesterase [Parvicellaceae bacterium]